MNFKRERIRDYYLHETRVENVFINEYMVDAPGDFVKVYLFALMYADIRVAMDNETIAKQLFMDVEDVLKAWTYWEKKGVIKRSYPDEKDKYRYRVEFINLKELIYGKSTKKAAAKKALPDHMKKLMDDDKVRDMYSEIERVTGRFFQGKETTEILGWIRDFGVSPEFVVYAYSYCVNQRNNSKHQYVAAVVKEWAGKGLKTVEQVENHLAENDSRHYLYKRVLKSMGMLRNATEEEKRLMDIWFDEYKFDIEKVLEACKKTSGISNPNINYVHSVMTGWSTGTPKNSGGGVDPAKKGIVSKTMAYYENLQAKNEAGAKKRRDEVYNKVPRIKELEEEARDLSLKISRAMLSEGPAGKKQVKELKEKVDYLNQEKAFLLTENNYKIDYMDIWYTCSKCKDTGILDNGQRCECFNDQLESYEK